MQDPNFWLCFGLFVFGVSGWAAFVLTVAGMCGFNDLKRDEEA